MASLADSSVVADNATTTSIVALFYKYVAIADVAAVATRQRALCASLGLCGRVRLAPEGINGHIAGSAASVAAYREAMQGGEETFGDLFKDVQFKLGSAAACPFDGELLVRVCAEITSAGPQMAGSLPASLGGTGAQRHLTPQEFHEAVRQCRRGGGELWPPLVGGRRQILIDTRNHYEVSAGTFEGAVDPKLRTFAQFPGWVAANADRLKGADVYLFCTGGIRCEKAAAYLDGLGVCGSVGQLSGGVHAYLEAFSPEARASGIATVGPPPGAAAGADTAGALGGAATGMPHRPSSGCGGGECGSECGGCCTLKRARTEDHGAESSPLSAPRGSASPEEEGRAVSLWRGVNFTFDGRGAGREAGASGESAPRRCRCCCCGATGVLLDPSVVCGVCKDQILVCNTCRADAAAAADAADAAAAAAAVMRASSTTGNDAQGGESSADDRGGGGSGRDAMASDDHCVQRLRGVEGPAPSYFADKGVNFCKRLAAERASARLYLCTEHALLGPGWRAFLARAEANGLGKGRLEGARRALASMLAASTGRGGKGRRRSLALQLARLDEWLLAARPLALPEVSSGGAGGGSGGVPGSGAGSEVFDADGCSGSDDKVSAQSGTCGEWAAFFPLLSLWDY